MTDSIRNLLRFAIWTSPIHPHPLRFDPFEILEVSPGASAAEVKKVRSYHAPRHGFSDWLRMVD